MDTPTVCAICNNPPEIPCSTCQELLYSSATCQASDAPIHKLACSSFTSLPSKPEGGSKYVLGVLFPDSSPVPSLVWVRIGGFTDEESGISFQEAEVGDFLDDDGGKTPPESLHSERNRVRNRDTRSMLEVWHVKSDALKENVCIAALAVASSEDGKGVPFHQWRGSVLVLFMTRSTGFMVDPGAYRDCQLQDFRDAVDFVVDYGNDVHGKRIREALDTLGTPAVGDDEDGLAEGSKDEVDSRGQAEEEGPKHIVMEMEG